MRLFFFYLVLICILREEKRIQRQNSPQEPYKTKNLRPGKGQKKKLRKKGAQGKRKTRKQNKGQNKGSGNLIYKIMNKKHHNSRGYREELKRAMQRLSSELSGEIQLPLKFA